jgi:hypothetical protein
MVTVSMWQCVFKVSPNQLELYCQTGVRPHRHQGTGSVRPLGGSWSKHQPAHPGLCVDLDLDPDPDATSFQVIGSGASNWTPPASSRQAGKRIAIDHRCLICYSPRE